MRTLQIGGAEYRQAILTAKDVNLHVPDDGYTYVQTMHDFQIFGRIVVATEKYAVPAICGDVSRVWFDPSKGEVRAYDFVPLPEAWQYFMLNLWRWSMDDILPLGKWEGTYKNASNPDMIFDKYTDNSMLWYYDNMIQDARSHTDSDNVQGGFCDFVTGRNMGARPYAWLTKSTTGNILRVLRDLGTQYEVEAIDLSKDPPPVSELVQKPWLLHWATETGKRTDGSFYVSRYPQARVICKANGWMETGTPIPNTSLGGSYKILKRRVRLMKPNQSYSPYVPLL
jgi:hypothetical protein